MPDEPHALIPYQARLIGSETIPTVDGRDLYQFLEVLKPYPTWVKAQIKRARLVEHRDFEVYYQEGRNPQGGRPSLEYFFTFDAGKHIGMLSNTDKGHQVREYFLTCERHLKQGGGSPQVKDPKLQMVIDLAIRLDHTEQRAQEATDRAIRAETKADLALADTRHQTLETFIISNSLLHQFPLADWPALAKRLGDFCALYNLPTCKVDVQGKPWTQESAYPLQALAWLVRYPTPRMAVLRFGGAAKKDA
jgi:phage anti-repressor protein